MAEPAWMLEQGDLLVERLSPQSMLILRVKEADEATVERIRLLVETALPAPNRCAGAAPRIYWLSPGRWLLGGGAVTAAALHDAIMPALGHVADVGEGRVRYRVAGASARDLLAKGTSLDLHPAAFAPDHCGQTWFAQTHALIARMPDRDDLELHADISFAHHLEHWFEDAAIEFRKQIEREG